MNKLDKDYQDLLYKVMEEGSTRDDRTGTGTLSLFGTQIRHNMADGFPLLTSKKMAWKTMQAELKWFLKGETNIKPLLEDNCNIWTGDAYKKFNKYFEDKGEEVNICQNGFSNHIKANDDFAKKWGELGPIYGKQWRKWRNYDSDYYDHDQIKELVSNLTKDPYSRRHLVSAWNVGDLERMTLPPCHYAFQCYVNEGKLSLMWQQRSADLFLGVPFNIASYGLLLKLLANETGLQEGELIGNFGDTHLYSNHLLATREQLKRTAPELPTVSISKCNILEGEFEVELNDYNPLPAIKAPLSN